MTALSNSLFYISYATDTNNGKYTIQRLHVHYAANLSSFLSMGFYLDCNIENLCNGFIDAPLIVELNSSLLVF